MAISNKLVDVGVTRLKSALKACSTKSLAILVDPTLLDAMASVSDIEDGSKFRLRIRHPDMNVDSQPYLIWVEDEMRHERIIDASISASVAEAVRGVDEDRHARSICAWLMPSRVCSFEPEGLVNHLSACATINAKGGGAILFRFYDPRVMDHLPRILQKDQMNQLLGPIGIWSWLGQDGQWNFISNDDPIKGGFSSLSPSQEQCNSLIRIGWLGRAKALASEWGERAGVFTMEALDRQLARAQAFGFSSEDDCMVFATCAFLIGDNFDQDPVFAGIIRESALRNGIFASNVAQLDRSILEGVSQRLSTQDARI